MDAQGIIDALRLKPHPKEGGYFVESYRSEERLNGGTLPGRYSGSRSVSTAIYYLLTPDSYSEMHRLESDELFHFYLGDPVEMLQLWPDGEGRVVKLGSDIAAGMHPQMVVPRGVWQGARVAPGGRFALMGTTVAPGFDYVDYESGIKDELCRLYPGFERMIEALTR